MITALRSTFKSFFQPSLRLQQARRASLIASLKPEVVLTADHHVLIDGIVTLWSTNKVQARQMQRAFVALCNQETH